MAVLLSAALFFHLPLPAHAEAPREQLNATLESLEKSKASEAALKDKLTSSAKEVEAIRGRATNLAERLQQAETRVSAEEEALEKTSGAYEEKRRAFEARKADYVATVRSLLRLRNIPPTALFSSSEETVTLLRSASVLEKTNEAIATKATRLRADLAEMKKLQSAAKQREASTKAERLRLADAQAALNKELIARKKMQDQLASDHAKAEAKVAELSRQSQSLQELISKLDAEQKAQAKAAAAKPAPKLREFAGKKGSLKAPVAGQVLHRFGEKQGENGTYRGMVFKARGGATVVAPYDGEVVFTGPFRDYGNMVLLKHKNGYISLIAGLGSISTSLGQTATRGEPIGAMPATSNGEAYVELRGQDAKPIDPVDWFASVVR